NRNGVIADTPAQWCVCDVPGTSQTHRSGRAARGTAPGGRHVAPLRAGQHLAADPILSPADCGQLSITAYSPGRVSSWLVTLARQGGTMTVMTAHTVMPRDSRDWTVD